MTVTLNRLLAFVAMLCFVVALLLTTDTVLHSGNATAWGYAGLAFLAGSFLP